MPGHLDLEEHVEEAVDEKRVLAAALPGDARIGDMKDVFCPASSFEDAGPTGEGIDTNPAFKVLGLAPAVDSI